MRDAEEKEAAIIKEVYSSGASYSHAENILHRLSHLHLRHSHVEAIEILYIEVVVEGGESGG